MIARAAAVMAVLAVGCASDVDPHELRARLGSPASQGGLPAVLAFSRTEGFRHASIDVAIPTLQQLGAERGFTVDATEDPTMFDEEQLAAYDVVAFVMTTGDVLDETQQEAFESWLKSGRGYVGVHSATDTEYDWPWYGALLGGYFDGHPAPQQASVLVVDGEHPSTSHLETPWVRFDEWYNFAPNPSATVDVLLRLDESTYSGGSMGDDHPIAWTHEYDGGRAFYTGAGHTNESWAEPDFLAHVAGGILWAATPADRGGTSTGVSTATMDDSSAGADAGGSSAGPSPGTTGDDGPPNADGSETGAQPSGSTSIAATGSAGDTDNGGALAQSGDDGCSCRTSGGHDGLRFLVFLAVAVPLRSRRRR